MGPKKQKEQDCAEVFVLAKNKQSIDFGQNKGAEKLFQTVQMVPLTDFVNETDLDLRKVHIILEILVSKNSKKLNIFF
jgi:hypothetical protein